MTVTVPTNPPTIGITYGMTGLRDVVIPTQTVDGIGGGYPYMPYDPTLIGPGLIHTTATYTPAPKFSTCTSGEDTLIASVDIPGVTKESLKVRMVGYTLIVEGKRRDGQSVRESTTIHQQWDVRNEKIEGFYQDGVLEVYFRKSPDAAQEIKIGYGG